MPFGKIAPPPRPLYLKRRLLFWLKTGYGILREASSSRRRSRVLRRRSVPLAPSAETSAWLRQAWQELLAQPGGGTTANCTGISSAKEQELIGAIRRQTAEANRNNVTRTAAYLALYRQHPELHWALLAHMVSRNGGWSMTDLAGDLMPLLLSPGERRNIFEFLERSNALIFHDAYPQLLLYRESLAAGKPLFYLLPQLGVSRFMLPVWERFWLRREPAPLTVCLIMNEQHYIEGRVVQNPYFRKNVLERPAFRFQAELQETQVAFPYRRITPDGTEERFPWRLCGLTLERFSHLRERIEVGKALYAILFGNPLIKSGVHDFAAAQPHTGSRADYHPALFTAAQKASPRPVTAAERLDGYGVRAGAPLLYSPRLADAWADQPFEAPGGSDWFTKPEQLRPFGPAKAPRALDSTGESCLGLYKLELAAILKTAISQETSMPASPQDGPASPAPYGWPEADPPHSPEYIPGLPSAAAGTEESPHHQ
ncbi:MAG: hypothetical protein K0Q90_677 [Paenibacillaceae bacterium]|jgi:hypothetical protein|nr:hypothetical protein [Paenibacillaceae bacterium]